MGSADFRSVADAIAADIAAGRLPPGAKLPPQRDFAYAQGIAVSTASRVYAELGRRGLVTGEVGRGTYVRSAPGRNGLLQPEPPPAAIDLQRTHSRLPEQEAVLAETLAALAGEGGAMAFGQYGPAGTPQAQAIAAAFLARDGHSPRPGRHPVHRQRAAGARGGARRAGGAGRADRLRAPDLPDGEGDRGPARDHAGAGRHGCRGDVPRRAAPGPPGEPAERGLPPADPPESRPGARYAASSCRALCP